MSSTDSQSVDFNPSQKPDRKATKDEQWTYLLKAVTYIMAHPEGIQGLGPAAINMHSVVYDLCENHKNQKTPWVLYPSKIQRTRVPQLPEQMHERLTDFLESYFENVYLEFESLHGVSLLRHYAEQFDRASASARHLDRVCNHLNRTLMLWPSLDANDYHKYDKLKYKITVEMTVFKAWRDGILSKLQQDLQRLTVALLEIIHQPEVEEHAEALVRRVLESLIALDDHLTISAHQSTLYQDHFQSKFLADWDTFCSKRTEAGAQDAVIPSLEAISLQPEMERLAKFLPETTQQELLARSQKTEGHTSLPSQ